MKRVLTRVLWSGVILFVLSFALFGALSALPGDPIDLLVTSNPNVKAEDVLRLKKLRGLDKPWPVRWARWLVGHPEPKEPPRAPLHDPFVVELPHEGPAVVNGHRFALPGIHDVPFVVQDGALEDVGVDTYYVSPQISAVPTDDDHDDSGGLDDEERQLGGSTEHTAGVGVASQKDLVDAATKIGRAVPVASPRVVEADDDGHIVVAMRALSEVEGARFRVTGGPGAFAAGKYTHDFDTAGRTAIVYEVESPDGARAHGAFIVEHGVVVDPDRYHRGALFVFLGDTEALGYSSTYKRPVWELLSGRIPNTLSLMVPAFLLALLVSVPLGSIAAQRRGSFIDKVALAASVVAVSVPAFWLGLMGIVIFAAKLQLLPAGGIATPGVHGFVDVVIDRVHHMILPVLVLAVAYGGQWLRYVRGSVLEVLPADFVRTAHAKGLEPRTVLVRHALRNALLPLVTVLALAAPQMFAGALLTETVFAWPGIGRLLYESILNNDSYVAIVVFMISAALVLSANLLADVLYVVIDPRLRRKR